MVDVKVFSRVVLMVCSAADMTVFVMAGWVVDVKVGRSADYLDAEMADKKDDVLVGRWVC